MNFKEKLTELLNQSYHIDQNLILVENKSKFENQEQTNKAFDYKWESIKDNEQVETTYDFQKKWYLSLYDFNTESKLKNYLSDKKIIVDAGCGLGYKAAWFAELSPDSLVIGIDYSESVRHAAQKYNHLENLFFYARGYREYSL